MRRLAATCGTALALLAIASAPAGAVAFRDGFGLHVRAVRTLDARLLALSVASSAIPGPANLRILLPAGYGSHPHRRYGVLYLLHGTSGGASDWTTSGGAEQATAGRPLIVVMPDIGLGGDGGGWCTNWVQRGPRAVGDVPHRSARAVGRRESADGTSAGRTGDRRALAGRFLLDELCGATPRSVWRRPVVLRCVRTSATTSRHTPASWPILTGIEVGLDHVAPNSIFGSPVTDEINWAAHDPTTLAGNLRWTKLFLFTGNGPPGPLDPTLGVGTVGASSIEAGVHLMTTLFHQRLEKLGIPSVFDDYGPGTHSWPYWTRDLRESIGPVTAMLTHPAARPTHLRLHERRRELQPVRLARDAASRRAAVQHARRRRPRRVHAVGQRHRFGDDGAAVPAGDAVCDHGHECRRADASDSRARPGPTGGCGSRISLGSIGYTSHVRITGATMSGPRIRPGTPAEIGRVNTSDHARDRTREPDRPAAEPVHDAGAPAWPVPRLADVRRATDAGWHAAA